MDPKTWEGEPSQVFGPKIWEGEPSSFLFLTEEPINGLFETIF